MGTRGSESLKTGNVLVPIDGSYISEIATHLAVDTCRTYESHITFVYVMDTSDTGGFGNVDSLRNRYILEEEGRLALEHATSAAKEGGVSFESIIIEGRPDLIIKEMAMHQELVIMGITGKSGILKKRMGRTAMSVIEDTGARILALKSGSDHMNRIMLPVEGCDDETVAAAARSSDLTGASVSIFYTERTETVEIIRNKLRQFGIEPSDDIGKGDSIEAMIARSGMFDEIIISRSLLGKKYRNVSKTRLGRIVLESMCPVLICPEVDRLS